MKSLSLKHWIVVCGVLSLGLSVAHADTTITATSRENHQLVKVDIDTNTVTVLHTTVDIPDSLVIDSLNRIIYTEPVASDVRRWDPASNTDVQIASSANGINTPQDIVLEPGGNSVLVSNFLAGTITRTNLTTLVTTTLVSKLPFPEGLAYDAAGHLFANAGWGPNGTNSAVYQINPTTGAIVKTSTNFDPTQTLDGLVYDPFSGLLYATSKNGEALYSIDPSTLIGTSVGTVPVPDGPASDGHGLIYIASRGATFRIYSFNVLTNVSTPLTPVPGIDDLSPFVTQSGIINKTFLPINVAPGGSSTVTFTIQNPNSSSLSGISFTDNLPSGLTVALVPNVVGTCGGGTIGAVASATSITLTNATLAGNSSCTFSVDVKTSGAGPFNNCVNLNPTGTQSCAVLTVVQPVSPTITKSFSSPTVLKNGTVVLTFLVANNNASAVSGISFTDSLPSGIFVAGPASGTCTGTVTAVLGSGSVSLSEQTLNATTSCTVIVPVTGTVAGAFNNCVTVGPGGNTSCAPLTVIIPPEILKSFAAPSITLGGTTSVSFKIMNPNQSTALTGVNFTDTLPAGLIVATPSGILGSCPGGTITAVAGSNQISLSGVTLAAAASCTFSVNVIGVAIGTWINTTSTINSGNGGNGPPATATLTVEEPPDAFQVRYASHLEAGDSFVNIVNTGVMMDANAITSSGNICVNVYTFDPAEELIACCACLATPNSLNSLSVRGDLISNTLTRGAPTSVVIKLLASTPSSGFCNASTPTATTLVPGMRAWGTSCTRQTHRHDLLRHNRNAIPEFVPQRR